MPSSDIYKIEHGQTNQAFEMEVVSIVVVINY